jgi:hypothetical protein
MLVILFEAGERAGDLSLSRASFVTRMWSTQSPILCLALQLTAVAGAINHDAEPYVVAMVNNAFMGPDGMHNYVYS